MLTRGELFPVPVAAERVLDRRRFLRAAGVAAALAVVGEWTARWYGAARPPAAPIHLPDGVSLGVGEARSVTAAGREVLIVRLHGGVVVGFDRRCPHLGCPVLWAAARGRFECPCHHAAFDARTGRVLFGPPREGLAPVPVSAA